MKRIPLAFWLAVLVAAVTFVLTWSFVPRGIDPADAAELARRSGDSAVASYKKGVAAVIGQLTDSVSFYRGKAEAGVRIEVRHVSGSVRDVTPPPSSAPPAAAPVAVELVPPLIRQGGVTIAESLKIAPAPVVFERRIAWTVDPDTIVAALVRTPEGLQRFTAAGTRAGLSVRVLDAAVTRPRERRTLKLVTTALTAVSCGLFGWGIGAENGTATTVGAGGCGGGVVLRQLLR